MANINLNSADSIASTVSELNETFPGEGLLSKHMQDTQSDWILESEKPNRVKRFNQFSTGSFRLAAIFSIVLLASLWGITYLQNSFSKPQVEVWIAYPVERSDGPPIQLRIEKSNTTEWLSSHKEDLESFAFRIDDQTLIPKELLSPQEIKYQSWFQKFYPQLWDVYRSGEHLDDDYLDAAPSNMIHVDLRFHLSHCVLALRRYWNARESGKHVCSRDLDPGHIEHCLNSLDEWAFPEDGISPKHNVWLEWITQVCEYEP
jgi:hypothetical protein